MSSPTNIIEATTAEDLLDGVGGAVAAGVAKWAVGEALTKIIGGNADTAIIGELSKIAANQHQILKELAAITSLINWDTENEELSSCEIRIDDTFDRLIGKGQPPLETGSAEQLVKHILHYIPHDANVLNNVYLGHRDSSTPNVSLFQTFMQKAIAQMRAAPATLYTFNVAEQAKNLLTAAFFRQVKAAILLVNAHLYQKDNSSATDSLTQVHTNMSQQQILFKKPTTVPPIFTDLVDGSLWILNQQPPLSATNTCIYGEIQEYETPDGNVSHDESSVGLTFINTFHGGMPGYPQACWICNVTPESYFTFTSKKYSAPMSWGRLISGGPFHATLKGVGHTNELYSPVYPYAASINVFPSKEVPAACNIVSTWHTLGILYLTTRPAHISYRHGPGKQRLIWGEPADNAQTQFYFNPA